MCLSQSTHDKHNFTNWLLNVGHGKNIDSDGTIAFDADMRVLNADTLISQIYLNINEIVSPPLYFLDCIILAPRNSDVDDLNAAILIHFSELESIFYSTDSVETESGMNSNLNYILVEFLWSLEASGLPPGELHLKPGCLLILLHILAPA